MRQLHFYTLIFVVFTATVLVRLPNLNRPLSKHHEFATATTLVFNDVWQQRGFFRAKGAPCSTYSGEGNRFCENLGMFAAENGDFYYLSHGPLAFYFTYLLGFITGGLSVWQVQVFNLFLHLLTLFWVGKIISFLFPKAPFLLFAGLTLYGFAPILLWCHGNCYVHEAVVFPFYYGAFYSLLKLLFVEKKGIWYAALLFHLWLAIYTDWLGAMFAAVAGISALFYNRREHAGVFAVCLSGSFVFGFIIWQYGQLDTVKHFLEYFQQRVVQRSGTGDATTTLPFTTLLVAWAKHHFIGFGSIFIVIIGVFFKIKQIKIPLSAFSAPLKFALFIATTTVFIYELGTFEFCGTHDYSVMKSFFPLLLFALYLFAHLPQNSWNVVFLGAITLLNIGQYYYINRPGDYSQNGDRYDSMQRIGQTIATHSSSSDLVLYKGFEMNAQILYYAKHNVEVIENKEDIPPILEKHGTKTAILIEIEQEAVVRIDTLSTGL